MEAIFKQADLDGNGELDYSEWAVATMNKESVLTDKKLKATFNLFDKVRIQLSVIMIIGQQW